jgi:hypothetical protein
MTTTEKPDEPTFEDVIAEITDLAFAYGIRKVGGLDPREASADQMKRFTEACHEGYALAQHRLVEELGRVEAATRGAKRLQKEARRQRERQKSEAASRLLETLHYQEMALRTIANGMAWIMLRDQRWVVRRLHQGRAPTALSAANMEAAIREADRINQDPRKFALLSDLTSCVQLGDLLVVDFSREPAMTYCVELKEGQKNYEILQFLDSFSRTGCPRAASFFAEEQGEAGLKQAQRIARQQMRAAEAMKILETGEGVDAPSGNPIMIPDQAVPEETYDRDLETLVGAARVDGEGVAVLEGCLWIGAYDSQRVPFPSLMFKDHLHHALLKREDCLLPESPLDVTEELLRRRVVPYPVIDLRHAVMTPTSRPLFLRNLQRETILDIALGRIEVYLYLDLDQFLARSQRYGLGGRWQTRRERREIRPDGYFRLIGKVPVFERGGCQVFMADGLIVKMLFDGVTVDSALFCMYAALGAALAGRVRDDGAPGSPSVQ